VVFHSYVSLPEGITDHERLAILDVFSIFSVEN
jgi:hypothetical protein